jgi:hypothetical protein
VLLTGLPASGTWTLTRLPDSTLTTGTGTTSAITNIHPGVYSFRVISEPGCISETSDNITIEEPDPGVVPRITIKYNDVLICYNLGDSLLSYQWFEGPNPIPDATIQYYQTHKQPGTYRVFTTDVNGCSNFSKTITLSPGQSLVAFPNPAFSSFGLKLERDYEGPAKIRILSSSGIIELESDMKYCEQ